MVPEWGYAEGTGQIAVSVAITWRGHLTKGKAANWIRRSSSGFDHCATAIARSQTDGRSREFLVEAAGVEPASENVTGQETTCLFRFMPQALGAIAGASPRTFAAPAQNGQETDATSLKS